MSLPQQVIDGREPTGVDDPLGGLPPRNDAELAALEGAGRTQMKESN